MISVEQLIYRKKGTIGEIKDSFSRLSDPGRKEVNPKVVMYHSVEEDSQVWCPRHDYSVTPAELETQLKHFQKKGNIVDLPEIVSWLRGEASLPENAVALTFDDGYKNNKENALPLLEKYNAPATIYISTGLISYGKPFEYCLAELLKQKEKINLEKNDIEKEISNDEDRREAYQKIRRFGKPKNRDERQELLDMIGNTENIESILMNEVEIRDIAENQLLTIGSHSRDHVMLNKIGKDDVRKNILESKRKLEEILDKKVDRFCYPYGSSNRSVRKFVGKAGYRSAVATGNREIRPRDWNQAYRIPRVDGSNLQL